MYFITSLYRDENLATKKGADLSHPCIANERCFGYVELRNRALEIVDKNEGELHELLYNWLVVEWIPQGIHPHCEKEIWFTWDSGLNRWIHAEKPGWSYKIINWAIG